MRRRTRLERRGKEGKRKKKKKKKKREIFEEDEKERRELLCARCCKPDRVFAALKAKDEGGAQRRAGAKA